MDIFNFATNHFGSNLPYLPKQIPIAAASTWQSNGTIMTDGG